MIDFKFTRINNDEAILAVSIADDLGFGTVTKLEDRQKIVHDLLCKVVSYASSDTIESVLDIYNYKNKAT